MPARLTGFSLLLMLVLSACGGLRSETFIYGEAMTLSANATYQPHLTGQPILVVMHGFSGTSGSFTTATKERIAGYGVFALFVEMRGRDTSGGTADASAREIQDIIDAVEYVKTRYASIVDPDNVNIVGYSGGGGNALASAAKFPDYWNTVTSFFGMSDYGYDATDGWYQNGADAGHITSMQTWIGGTPAAVPDAYHARAHVLAITNYSGGHLWLFHDASDSSVPVVNSQNVADAMGSAALTNYTLNITTAADSTRWVHGYPNTGEQASLIEAEPTFITPIMSGTNPAWTVPASGTLKVAGYLVTKRFDLWLGTGDNEFGEVTYNMTTRVFTITSDTGAADYALTLKGQTPSASISATINGVEDTQTSDADGNVTFTGSVA
jgi:dienelactone hydrolase